MRIANQMSSVPNLPFFLLLNNISTVILLVCFHLTDERAIALLFKKFEKFFLDAIMCLTLIRVAG